MAGDQPHQQPGRCAAVAHVERRPRLQQSADTHTIYAPHAIAAALYLGAHRPHGGCGCQHIFAFQQAGNPAFAYRQRRQHQRTVADRLVARHTHFPAERMMLGETGGAWGGTVHGPRFGQLPCVMSNSIFDSRATLWQGRRRFGASLVLLTRNPRILKG
jgi:hypothetical protein